MLALKLALVGLLLTDQTFGRPRKPHGQRRKDLGRGSREEQGDENANGNTAGEEKDKDAFEGDIIIPKEAGKPGTGKFRNAIGNMNQRWTNGVIPYTICSSQESWSVDIIQQAMHEIEVQTAVNGRPCITFPPRTVHNNYIEICRGTGCSSRVGMSGGLQGLSIGYGCDVKGIVMHELLHAAGFWHEQSRADRDDYITINWANIRTAKESNFNKYSLGFIKHLAPYDYDSVMHYGKFAFARDYNGPPVIVPKVSGVKIGQRDHLSRMDIDEIRSLYQCTGPGGETIPPYATMQTTTTLKPVTLKAIPLNDRILDCNFDASDRCGFVNTDNDDTDWLFDNTKTPSSSTGPTGDHTGSGYFAYIEGSGHASHTAKLESPKYTNGGTYCVQFYYHMYGNNMGTLRALSKCGRKIAKLWELDGNQGDTWKAMQLEFSCSGKARVIFEGQVGSGYRSDMAIDDVMIGKMPCPYK